MKSRIYGNEPRVKCRSLRGPWQEVQITAHSWEEIDIPEFWSFLDEAVAGFQKFTAADGTQTRRPHALEEAGPALALHAQRVFAGQASPVGCRQSGKNCTKSCSRCAPDGQFLWNNQVLVHLLLKSQREPWITIMHETLRIARHDADRAEGMRHARTHRRDRPRARAGRHAPDRDFVRLSSAPSRICTRRPGRSS